MEKSPCPVANITFPNGRCSNAMFGFREGILLRKPKHNEVMRGSTLVATTKISPRELRNWGSQVFFQPTHRPIIEVDSQVSISKPKKSDPTPPEYQKRNRKSHPTWPQKNGSLSLNLGTYWQSETSLGDTVQTLHRVQRSHYVAPI